MLVKGVSNVIGDVEIRVKVVVGVDEVVGDEVIVSVKIVVGVEVVVDVKANFLVSNIINIRVSEGVVLAFRSICYFLEVIKHFSNLLLLLVLLKKIK